MCGTADKPKADSPYAKTLAYAIANASASSSDAAAQVLAQAGAGMALVDTALPKHPVATSC